MTTEQPLYYSVFPTMSLQIRPHLSWKWKIYCLYLLQKLKQNYLESY